MKKQLATAAIVGALSFGLVGCAPSEQQVSDAVNEIITGYDYTESQAKYDEFEQYMNDNQRETCTEAIHDQKIDELKQMGSDYALDIATSYVKERLKSPSSFTLYDYSSEWQYGFEEGEGGEFAGSNNYEVEFTYGATNSFGGEVTSDAHFYVPITFDVDAMEVSFDSDGVFMALNY